MWLFTYTSTNQYTWLTTELILFLNRNSMHHYAHKACSFKNILIMNFQASFFWHQILTDILYMLYNTGIYACKR